MLENHIVIIRGVDCSGFVVLFVCKGKKNIWIVQGVGVRKGSGSIVSKPKTHTPPLCPFRLIIIYEPTLKSKVCLKCLYFTKNNP